MAGNDRQIEVSGISSNVTRDYIELFFEQEGVGGNVEDVEYFVKEAKAIVTFEDARGRVFCVALYN